MRLQFALNVHLCLTIHMCLCVCAGTEVVSCPVTLVNTGHMLITNVTATGLDNNCSTPEMPPSAITHCSMWTPVDAATNVYHLEVVVSGTAAGPKPLPTVPTVNVEIANPQATLAVPMLQVFLTANTTVVNKAEEAVMLTVTAVSLRPQPTVWAGLCSLAQLKRH